MKKENEEIVNIDIDTNGIGNVSSDSIDETIDVYKNAREAKNVDELDEDYE
jgi:hypothetical protein